MQQKQPQSQPTQQPTFLAQQKFLETPRTMPSNRASNGMLMSSTKKALVAQSEVLKNRMSKDRFSSIRQKQLAYQPNHKKSVRKEKRKSKKKEKMAKG